MAGKNYDSLKANWKCMLAIVLVSLSPFQYGIDFGLIGGIQAMIVRYDCEIDIGFSAD